MESNTVVTRLLELARVDPKYLDQLESLRRTLVVMFTDVHGSTAYFEKHGDAAGLLLVHECNGAIRSAAEKRGGRVIKTIGDGCMLTFDDCAEAIAAAIQMQLKLRDMNAGRLPDEQISIRVGLHYGPGIVKSNDVFGDVVNMASRVESVALPRQIVISDQLFEQIKSFAFRTAELGHFSLKGKTGEQLLHEVLWQEDETKPFSQCAPAATIDNKAQPTYKLQVILRNGSVGAEHLLASSLTIGRSQGDIKLPDDAKVSPLHARVFIDEGLIFIEDISQGGESVFLRLSAAYTLQNGDIVIMGSKAFRFHEDTAAMSAATIVAATVADLSSLMSGPVAEFIRLDIEGKPNSRYPLRSEAVQFGRAKGTYTFPEDKLMSRLHARVLQRGEDFVIEDAGSRNGTFVKVREKAPLPVNSAVLIGSYSLKLVECP